MGGFFKNGGMDKIKAAAQSQAMRQNMQPAKKKGLPVVGGTAAAASPNISMGQRGVM